MMDGDSRIARYATLQSITEIGLGSFLHALHIPLRGHFLSLNQGVLATFAVRPDAEALRPRRRGMFVACGVSFITAALKFLSPAGARAMPAFAISLQGLLYSAGIALFGLNLVGAVFGSILLSFWAFLHPVVFAYLIFGETFFQGIVKLWTELAEKLGWPVELGAWILLGVVALKILVAAALGIFAWRVDAEGEARYFERARRWAKKGDTATARTPPAPGKPESPIVGATRDLFRPIFFASLVVSVGFVLYAGTDTLGVLGYLARTIGVAWTIFFSIRAFPRRWAERIARRFPAIAETAAEVRRSRD